MVESGALTPHTAAGFGSNDPLSDTSTVTWAAMSAIFEGYEKELQELSSAITRKAAQIPTLTRGTSTRQPCELTKNCTCSVSAARQPRQRVAGLVA